MRRPAGAQEPPDFGLMRKSAISGDIWKGPEIGLSGSRQDAIGARKCFDFGVYWIPAARFATCPSRVLQGVTGENGVRILTDCADRRGPACESRPAHTSPVLGPTRRSAISGDSVRGIRKSGFRDLVRLSRGEVYWIPAARVLTSRSRAVQVSGENGARKLTHSADRRGSAFQSRAARKSPDSGRRQNLRFPGTFMGKSGNRDSGASSTEFQRRVF